MYILIKIDVLSLITVDPVIINEFMAKIIWKCNIAYTVTAVATASAVVMLMVVL